MTVQLTVRASNGVTSSLTLPNAAVNAPVGTIPLSYNDPRFIGNVTSAPIIIPNGGTRENLSITQTGNLASIQTRDGATIRKCRIDSREAIRIGGGGNFLIDNCYLRAIGINDDHADTIQAYSPGDEGTIRVVNSSIVNGGAATAGMFVSDNWAGTIDLENVVFQQGPFGLRLHADTNGDLLLFMKNVFFVGPFVYAPYMLLDYGGRRVIVQRWENVRNATIVNDVLVPGSIIQAP